MVQKLRKKFVLVAMTALTLILILLVGALNLANFMRAQKNADDLLRILSDNGGSFPREGFGDDTDKPGVRFLPRGPGDRSETDLPPGQQPGGGRALREGGLFGYNRSAETPFESRFFWVRLSLSEGEDEPQILGTGTANIAIIDDDTAATMAQALVAERRVQDALARQGEAKGRLGDYRYLLRSETEGETEGETVLAVFLDRQNEYHSVRLLFVVSILISLAVLGVMFLLMMIFSLRAVAPIVEAFEKQKRFISDAGHELKTPLSVIQADVDVLELSGEKSEWTASIRDQIARMNQLIRDMLTLSRMEDDAIRVVFADVDLSAAISKAAEPFRAVAAARDVRLELSIEEGLHLTGDEAALGQLVSILMDNAMKYVSKGESGYVRLLLERHNRQIRLEVANTCDHLPEGDLDRLFDRFYRADASRNRGTGGFGIGLSVARAIVTTHGGKIRAERDGDHMIRFVAQFAGKDG